MDKTERAAVPALCADVIQAFLEKKWAWLASNMDDEMDYSTQAKMDKIAQMLSSTRNPVTLRNLPKAESGVSDGANASDSAPATLHVRRRHQPQGGPVKGMESGSESLCFQIKPRLASYLSLADIHHKQA